MRREGENMPYIEVKTSVKIDENKKNALQSKMTDAVAKAFSKPKMYIMANIEEPTALFMGGKKIEKGAYVSVSLLGAATKSACQNLTQDICNILSSELGIEGENVYITYHPVELWGWNSSMF
jgi:phenylpyruvate tautomerase PptA (4-oxalocrotonate tautomerase family)